MNAVLICNRENVEMIVELRQRLAMTKYQEEKLPKDQEETVDYFLGLLAELQTFFKNA